MKIAKIGIRYPLEVDTISAFFKKYPKIITTKATIEPANKTIPRSPEL